MTFQSHSHRYQVADKPDLIQTTKIEKIYQRLVHNLHNIVFDSECIQCEKYSK